MNRPTSYRHSSPAGPSPQAFSAYDGILPIDKPAGPTSHDVVDSIRHHFRFAKVGHGGTLDPMATGVLIILLGKGTKLSSRFMGSDKTYVGTMLLGVSTDSQDAMGSVVREADPSGVTLEAVEAELCKLRGDLMQTPPMVSAVKVQGVPLYKRARKGQVVDRQPRMIHIYEFRILNFAPPRVEFLLRCTKGTYVRTLCSDIGDNLGCGAHLESLRRTMSGKISIDEAVSLDSVMNMTRDQLAEKIIPMHRLPPNG